jgi:hypothetical protein
VLTPGASCTLGINFIPLGVGSRGGSMTIASNATNGSTVVTSSGTATQAALTVTANSLPIVAGTTPSYTASYSGFVNGDTKTVVSGTAGFTGPSTPIATGYYTITPSVGSLTATNYTFTTFVNGTLSAYMAPVQAGPNFTIYGGGTSGGVNYGGPVVPQGSYVNDAIGVTATGFLYQYDTNVSSLEEGQYRIGTNTSTGYDDASLPAGLGSRVIKVWFTSDDLLGQTLPSPEGSYPNPGNYSVTYPNMPISGNSKTDWHITVAGQSVYPNSLVQLAQSPPMKELFSNPDFDTYILEAYEFASDCHDSWKAPTYKWTAGYQACVYQEFYDLTQYLLATYSTSIAANKKTFILQNWEGDNALVAANFTPTATPSDPNEPPAPSENCTETPFTSLNFCNSVVNMRQWLNLRWQGVNDARNPSITNEYSHTTNTYSNVTVAAAAEINLVDGFPTSNYYSTGTTRVPTVMDLVVPYLHMDLYSCSCYYSDSDLPNDSNLNDPYTSPVPPARPQTMYDMLRTYKTKIQQPQQNSYLYTGAVNPTPQADSGPPLYGGGANNSIYIGEFNTPESHKYNNDQWSDSSSLYARINTGQEVQGALAAGARWVLYWQIYSNDTLTYTNSPYNSIDGYWLIRPPCNATDSTWHWCSNPPAGYATFTDTWTYFANLNTMAAANNANVALPAYRNTYEAEDFYTGVSQQTGMPGSPTETDLADPNMTGGYGTYMQSATVGSTLSYSLFVPTAGTHTTSIRVKTGTTHGEFQIYLNGSATAVAGGPYETWASGSGYLTIPITGNMNYIEGMNTISLQVSGQHSGALGYNLIIDNIQIAP